MQDKKEETIIREISSLVVRQRMPEGEGPHPVLLLLHGWTGDESVMWVFTRNLSKRFLMLAPRGIYPAPGGGYGWQEHDDAGWPDYREFTPAIEAILRLLDPKKFPGGDFSQVYLMGFSQGAALTYTFSLLNPGRVAALAGLSGFMPEGVEEIIQERPLEGKPVYIAHGSLDELVPVEMARDAASLLEQAGARVTYCEEEVGHKLSAPCFRGLDAFFGRLGLGVGRED
jgi:phospholipase/carboxylesterase